MTFDEYKILLADVVISERELRLLNAQLAAEVERLKKLTEEPKCSTSP